MTESFDAYYEWLGIPPKDQPPHLYRLLGLEVFESNPAVIENAADRQMAHLRTFQSGRHSELSQRLLTELAKAKVLLLTPDKKAGYDKALRQKLQESRPAPAPAPTAPVAAAPNIQAAGPVQTQPAQASPLASRKPTKSKPPVWQHPAVLAGAVSGVVVAIIGFAIFMFSGGDPDEPDGGNVAVNPGSNGDPKPGDPTQPKPQDKPKTEDPWAGTFGVNNPVAPSSFGRPGIDTLDMIRLAWGLTAEEHGYALCQTADFAKLEEMMTAMAKTGFRPRSLRPYVFNGNTKFAAIWRLDGRPFRIAVGKTADEIREIDTQLKKKGFMPVDAAGYESDGDVVYSAVWQLPGVGAPATEMTVGLDEKAATGLIAQRRSQGWVPATIQYCFPQKGERRECEVWRRATADEEVFIRTGSELKFTAQGATTLPVSVSVAHNRATSTGQFSAVYEKSPKTVPAWETLNTGSPQDTLPAMRDRMKENMEPIALDVGRLWKNRRAQLRSVSVWNVKKGASPNARQRATIAKRALDAPNLIATKTAADDRLLSQGGGGVEVLNTQDIAKLGGSFTAEIVTRLAQHRSAEIEHLLMGTARGDGEIATGWQLVAQERPGNTTQLEFRYAAGSLKKITRPIPGNFSKWRNVAISGSGLGALWNLTLYVDGQPIVNVPIEKSSLKPANNNLTLGVHKQGANGLTFYGGLRQFRLSDGDRYQQKKYVPQSPFTGGVGVLSLLDFKRGDSSQMEDLSGSGGGRTGFRQSTVWLADTDAMPGHPGGAALVGNPPSEGGPTKPEVKPTPPTTATKIAAPTKAEIDAAVKQIQEVYKDDYDRAVTPNALIALADTLRKQANDESDNPSRYGLYLEAASRAADGGDVGLALSMVDELASRFEGDYWDERAGVISTAFKKVRSRPAKIAVAQSGFDVAQRAASEDRFEVAVKLYDSASSEARRAGDTELAKAINIRSRQVKAIRDEYRAAETAKTKIAAGSAKPEDYLKLGRFLCYLRDDWPAGLPHLAKGSDSGLATLAAADVKSPGVAKDQSSLADQWKTYADALKDEDEKKAVLRRAYHWYSIAMPNLTGLSKAKVERLMAEIASTTGGVVVAKGTKLAFLDVKPGKVHDFTGHSRDIRGIAVSASGRYLASTSYDNTVRLWDVATGKPLHTLTNNTTSTSYNGLAFTADERFVLAGTSRSNIAVWDTRTGAPASTISASADIADLAVSDDGRKLIFATRTSSQPNFGVVGLARRRALGVLKSPSYPRFVRIAADGNKAVSVDTSNNVALWNLVSFRPEANYPIQGSSVNDMAYSADGRVVAIVTSADQLLIWNPLSRQLEATLEDKARGSSSLYSVDLTRNGKHAVVADYYRGLVVWDIANKKMIGTVGGSSRSGFSSSNRWRQVRFLPDSRGAIAGDANGKLSLYRLPDF